MSERSSNFTYIEPSSMRFSFSRCLYSRRSPALFDWRPDKKTVPLFCVVTQEPFGQTICQCIVILLFHLVGNVNVISKLSSGQNHKSVSPFHDRNVSTLACWLSFSRSSGRSSQLPEDRPSEKCLLGEMGGTGTSRSLCSVNFSYFSTPFGLRIGG